MFGIDPKVQNTVGKVSKKLKGIADGKHKSNSPK